MRDHYGVKIHPKMYNQHAEQTINHIKTEILQLDDEMGLHSYSKVSENADVATCAVEPSAFKAQLHTLQRELENAIDEHLCLLRQNRMLKESSWQNRLELEYQNLSMEYVSLQAHVERKHKEVMACERIIRILQADIAQRREGFRER